jgi:hypothetical protein
MAPRLRTVLFASLLAGAPNAATSAQEFDSFTLKPGEARIAKIGADYVDLRVCNDATSASAVLATIEPRRPELLQPGECTEDRGGGIVFRNPGNGPAMVTYRRIFGTDMFDGG